MSLAHPDRMARELYAAARRRATSDELGEVIAATNSSPRSPTDSTTAGRLPAAEVLRTE
jgi:hypothetical protein